MSPNMEAPRPTGIGNGAGISKGVVPHEYRNLPINAKEFAAVLIAARFRIPPVKARLVCELAQIGGRAFE